MAGKIITDVGLNELAKLIAGSGNAMTHIAVGTGTNGPSVDDTGLEAEVLRKAATATVSGNEATFEMTINAGEIIDKNITEIGLFNADSGGTLYYREVRKALYFDESVGAIIKIRCTFERG